ncbi:putative inositol or phosphatidylinositol kinase [Hibiscus syriacus]|uniref:Inositol or phosphatidylinositol kinase n=1 Tax=Hibiscus syriacus TaxID=106335 RepID=A0A6A2WAE3_HIBSY|nr:putative inositol or phosphatidylinositol kinase [Hibiscus syriacus]
MKSSPRKQEKETGKSYKKGKQRSNGGKNNLMMMTTPSCGEALLRGQVNTLLQKVEEKAELSKIPLESRPFIHLQSPMALLVPTPANTPQVPNLSEDGGLGSTVMDLLPVVGEQLNISEMARGSFHGMSVETQKSAITRLCCRILPKNHIQERAVQPKRRQMMTLTTHQFGLSRLKEAPMMKMQISMTGMFTGKHRRFVNNSDGEIEGEEECGGIEDFFNSYHTLEGIANTKRKAPALPSRGGAGLTQLFSLIFFGWPSFLTPSAYFIL